MASPSLPSTPQPKSPDETQSPGRWRHPHLSEIVRRQNKTTFDNRNVSKLVWNGGAMVVTIFLDGTLKSLSLRLGLPPQFSFYGDLLITALRVLFVINILTALYPLFRPKDDLTDIDLTPTQRALFGLDPNATPPPTPGTRYITPPRYRVTSGTRTGSPSNNTPSPQSATDSPTSRRASYSPITASPLYQKALTNGNRDKERRLSFGASSQLGTSLRDSSFLSSSLSSTPASPLANKGNKLGVSSKWLYEKSRRDSFGSGSF